MSRNKIRNPKHRPSGNGRHAQSIEVGKAHAGRHAAFVFISIPLSILISISTSCLVSLEIYTLVFVAVVGEGELRVFELEVSGHGLVAVVGGWLGGETHCLSFYLKEAIGVLLMMKGYLETTYQLCRYARDTCGAVPRQLC